MKFVNIPKAANYDKFVDIMDKKILSFDILPYYYYKTYPVLTRDIELELKIIDMIILQNLNNNYFICL